MSDELPLPSDSTSEEALIGAIFIDPALINDLTITPEDFRDEKHQWIFSAMRALSQRGEGIDSLTVQSELGKNRLKEIGGAAYLTKLITHCDTAYNAPTYAAKVVERARDRRLIQCARQLLQAAYKGDADEARKISERAQDIAAGRGNPNASRFTVYTAQDALKPQSPIEWIIDRLFSEGSMSLVVGEAGSKKTWAMLDAAVCVSLGKAWLGLPTRQSTVLIVDEESGNRRIARRLGELLRGHLADDDTPIYYTSLARVDLRNTVDVRALQKLIVESGARFVIVDALVDVMPGADENAVKDVQPVFLALRSVAEITQAAIVVIHHANKLGGYRGSSAMKGAVDLMLLVESKPDSPNIDFSFDKARDAEPFQFAAVSHFGEGEFYLSASEPSERSKPVGKAQEYVMRYLAERGASSMEDIEANADTCSSNAARQAVYSLASLGKVKRVNTGKRGTSAIYDVSRG